MVASAACLAAIGCVSQRPSALQQQLPWRPCWRHLRLPARSSAIVAAGAQSASVSAEARRIRLNFMVSPRIEAALQGGRSTARRVGNVRDRACQMPGFSARIGEREQHTSIRTASSRLRQFDGDRGRFAATDAQGGHAALAATFLRRALIRVTTRRAPDAPIGWPSAQAPPLTLIFSCGMPSSRIGAMATTANASLISNRSTSSTFQPTLLEQLLDGPDRRRREPFRFLRVGGMADDARQRLEAALAGFVGAT